MSLARLFWIVACGDILALLVLILDVATGYPSQYDLIVEIFFLLVIGLVGAVMGTVALVRNRVAYAIGLALVAVPPLIYGVRSVTDLITTPSETALAAGHGYFTEVADRALADAVVAGDAAKVSALAPAADVNATGWGNMTFMRLALENGHANPEVVAALLKAGASPEQDSQLLFGFTSGAGGGYGMMVADRNEPLLRAVIGSGIDLNHENQEGAPRFFSVLQWPEGLALALDNGADTEAEDKDGNTAIMSAVDLQYWRSIDVLLAHGARLDHVAHGGKRLRDIVAEARGRQQGDPPPELVALEARLR